jgi:hypothetical protein
VPGGIPGGGFNAPPDVAAMALAVLSERFGSYVTGIDPPKP